jgi:glycosyltransferase involved in cell wall biosynthesis
MRIAYYVSNRTTIPPHQEDIAASTTVVINIIKQLSSRHTITLYAPQGSTLPGITVKDANIPPFRIDSNITQTDWTTKAVIGMKQLLLGQLFKDADQYDIIHLHTEPIYLGMPFAALTQTPVLFTTHNPYHEFEKEIFTFYENKVHLSALSHSQAQTFPFKKELPVIYNGLDLSEFPFVQKADSYFLFLGRLVEDKGIHTFLNIAEQDKNNHYVIAGKGQSVYEERAKELAKKQTNVTYLGMIPHFSKQWFAVMSKAKALVMPVSYADPCPLVPLEAMALGTPVIAFNKGSLPELVKHEKTGYIVNDMSEMNEAVQKINSLSKEEYEKIRAQARTHVETNFNIQKMGLEYEALYKRILSKGAK